MADPVTVITTGFAAAKALGLFGKKESQADIDKQAVQDKLAEMGYPQFSKMSGFGGNEPEKLEAMSTILYAVSTNSGAARAITNWLDSGGNITPETIRKTKQKYPPQPVLDTPGNSQSPVPGMDVSPIAATTQEDKNMLIGLAVAAVALVAAIIWGATR